jgi:thiosulfate/3-mercaptopyruvate sulfurtransferase
MRKSYVIITLLMLLMLTLSGCTALVNNDLGDNIVTSEDAKALIEQGYVLVDGADANTYAQGHIEGAISIPRGIVAIDQPFAATIVDKSTFESVMSSSGITNETKILIYDSNKNMDAARIFWTMDSYGHKDMKVVSGGLKALQEAGLSVVTEPTQVSITQYSATEMNVDKIATLDQVIDKLNNPVDNFFLIDSRTPEEYQEGRIPSSVLIPFTDNQDEEGNFKSAQDIVLMYQDKGIMKNSEIIVYCKSSVRAANTYLALTNAGYKNVKIYDGAYVEWSSDPKLPIEVNEQIEIAPVESNTQDNS